MLRKRVLKCLFGLPKSSFGRGKFRTHYFAKELACVSTQQSCQFDTFLTYPSLSSGCEIARNFCSPYRGADPSPVFAVYRVWSPVSRATMVAVDASSMEPFKSAYVCCTSRYVCTVVGPLWRTKKSRTFGPRVKHV